MSQVLFRDPVFDGATDPVLVFNRQERTWWMMYTSRRATAPSGGVGWIHGSRIGIASLVDDGATWLYRGTAELGHEPGHNTFWAPEVVWLENRYHMYVSYIKGVPERWAGHPRHILHYTSDDLTAWTYEGRLALSSDYVIDACIAERPDGGYRLWYKDEADGASTWAVQSEDLFNWEQPTLAVRTPGGHEGPNVFKFKGSYWMVVDDWSGLAAFRSDDQVNWEVAGKILEASDGEAPGKGADVGPGHHADVVVLEDRAFVVYFTHPWRQAEQAAEFDGRRSVVLAAELDVSGGRLTCARRRQLTMPLRAQDSTRAQVG